MVELLIIAERIMLVMFVLFYIQLHDSHPITWGAKQQLSTTKHNCCNNKVLNYNNNGFILLSKSTYKMMPECKKFDSNDFAYL